MLVFDNRGVGHSDTPEGKLWKTSEMALDALELLDHLGWKEEVGLMGVSMGGMIALELAQLAPPGRFSSLGLISTRAGNRNDLPSYKATYMFLRLLTGTVWSAQQAIALIVDTLFPASYLDVKDLTTDPIVSKRKSVEAVSPPPFRPRLLTWTVGVHGTLQHWSTTIFGGSSGSNGRRVHSPRLLGSTWSHRYVHPQDCDHHGGSR